jgi:hypothetical protein
MVFISTYAPYFFAMRIVIVSLGNHLLAARDRYAKHARLNTCTPETMIISIASSPLKRG